MAFSAVTSVVQKTKQILRANGHHQILEDEKKLLESLIQRFTFLQSFLEASSSQTRSQVVKSFEEQITEIAYQAEGIIMSYFPAQPAREENRSFLGRLIRYLTCGVWDLISASRGDQTFFRRLVFAVLYTPAPNVQNSRGRYQRLQKGDQKEDLQKVLKDIDSIADEIVVMHKKSTLDDLLSRISAFDLDSGKSTVTSRPVSSGKSTVVGLDDDLSRIKDQLTGSSTKREVISIVGMGGIGKTTLAESLYNDSLIAYHFDIRAWVTVSAQYHVKDILLNLLNSMKVLADKFGGESEDQLAELVYKSLKGQRYLIVMDDMWEKSAWDSLRMLFPDDMNGSRIMLTTRLSHVAIYVNCSSLHRMRFLTQDESSYLFCQRVFAKECCHPELEEIGNKIVQNCQGLPLAVVVIAGLLSKVKNRKYWENVAENINSIITKNEEKFMKILSLSYSHLPHHLKACFLYMGAFPEDSEIPVSKLINLWVAEGFIKEPSNQKGLEEVGEEYLEDLIGRSLILVRRRSSSGKIKTCSVHDLLRDLCLRQARSENFLHVVRNNIELLIADKTLCRLSIHPDVLFWRQSEGLMQSMSRVESLLCTGTYLINFPTTVYLGFRLMKILDIIVIHFYEFPVKILELFNLRYLGFTYSGQLPRSICELLNLETIVHHNWTFGHCPSLPQEIWNMPRLRHLYLTPNFLPDPSVGLIKAKDFGILKDLQTLSEVRGFICKKEILERIPNLKKLEISYNPIGSHNRWSHYQLENLVNLLNLETLKFIVKDSLDSGEFFPPKLSFPPKLKSLTLSGCRIPWEDMTIVGSLPNLEVLKLQNYAFHGAYWEPIEGEFCELKYLLIEKTDLVQWTAESAHFPKLQCLILKECFKLKEIPLGFGEIPTLNVIDLVDCRHSVATSAWNIQQEQESYGNETFKVRVYPRRAFKDKFHTRVLL